MVQTRIIGREQVEVATAWHDREIVISSRLSHRRVVLARPLGRDHWDISFTTDIDGVPLTISIPLGWADRVRAQDIATAYVVSGIWPPESAFRRLYRLRAKEAALVDILANRLHRRIYPKPQDRRKLLKGSGRHK